MQLVYTGAHPEVVVDELDGETVIVNGEPVEIPDDLAARLLNQSTWSEVATTETAAQKKAREDKEAADAAEAKAKAEADAATKGNA